MKIELPPSVEGRNADRELDELGLTEALLHSALERGEVERRSCTANDPSYLPGILAQARTMRALREALIPRGWVRADVLGLPLVVSPNGSWAITAATGDEGTGLVDRPVSTKHPKGSATSQLVVSNQLQLAIADAPELLVPPYATWVLLFRPTSDSLLAELSHPKTITKEGRIVEWSLRIILSALPLGTAGIELTAPPAPEREVSPTVRRRTIG